MVGLLLLTAAFALPAEAKPDLKGTLVVVNQRSDTATLVDLATMQAYKHVPVGGGPHEAAVSPDGKTAIVTNYFKQGVGPSNSLSVIELPSGDVRKTISLGEYRQPHDIRWVDGSRVVLTVEANQALLLVDVASGNVVRKFETGVAGSHMLSLSADRKRLYCSNMGPGTVTAFDFQTGAKLKEVRCGQQTEGVGVTLDGRWIWAGNRAEDTITIIDAEKLEVAKTVKSAGFPYRVQFTPNGKSALIPHATSGELVVFDVARQEETKRIKLGGTGIKLGVESGSPAGVFAHPDNRHAFVTVRNDNSVVVLDLHTGATLGRVAVQTSPDGVAYSPVAR